MNIIVRLKNKTLAIWKYLWSDVWNDTRSDWRIHLIKTFNLSIRSFLDSDLQSRAAALTYRTVLALVPALAILFAIGRGFGFHNLLQNQIFNHLPDQNGNLDTIFGMVDAYLAQSSQGVFVGIGIALLLWTMISLMNNIEYSFNSVWGIKRGRSLWRKITDYTAMLLILPVLLTCASGLTLFMTSTLQSLFRFEFMSPVISFALKCASYIFTWLFFAAMFKLIPNTKVKIKNALIAGVFSGTGFMILQWIFVSGQMYVSKYNAIYGSFSLLPLLLIWLYLSWIIILAGIVLCYSSQTFNRYNFSEKINVISNEYRTKIRLAIMSIITKHFANGKPAVSLEELSTVYNFPPRIAIDIVHELSNAGLISRVVIDSKDTEPRFQPAIDINLLSIAYVLNTLNHNGATGFIPHFDTNFKTITDQLDVVERVLAENCDNILLKDFDFEIKNQNSN